MAAKAKTNRRIACFGGTFDPVHNGHLIVADAIARRCGFERVLLIPTSCPPHKPPPSASAADRLEMLRLAVEGKPLLEVCDLEITRPGPSYTIDTVAQLRSRFGRNVEIHWIIGADMLAELSRWHRADELLEQVRFVIVLRPGWQGRMEEAFAALSDSFTHEQIDMLRASVVPAPLVDISSSRVRQLVGDGRPVEDLIPTLVSSYINSHALYRR